MAVTVEDLDRRTRARLSESDVDFFTEANLIDFFNEAQDVIATHVPFTAQTHWGAMVPSRATGIRLPEDCLTVTGAVLTDVNGRVIRLDYVEPDQMDRLKTYRTTRLGGTAYRCTVRTRSYGRTLEWDYAMTEDAMLSLAGHLRPRQMTDSDSVTEVPDHLTHVVVDYAAAMCKSKDEESREYEQAMAKFHVDLEALDINRRIEQADQFNQVRAGRSITARRYPGGGPWP